MAAEEKLTESQIRFRAGAKLDAVGAVETGFKDGVELCFRVLATNNKADAVAIGRFTAGVKQHFVAAMEALEAIDALDPW